MSAVLAAQEPSAKYLDAAQPALVRQFEVLATASCGVAQLRKLILTLAVRGKLVPPDPRDQSATKLLDFLRADKARLVAAGKAKQDRQLPPIAAEERPCDLPHHWEWVRLGELVELITSGSRDWAEHYSPSGAIFVRMGNLSRGSFRLRMQSIQHVRPPIGGEGSRTSLQEGDLLLSITGDVGLLGLVPPDFGEAYINQHTCLIRWLPRLRGEFMPVQLLSPFAQAQFNAPQRGIKNSFRLTDVSGLVVALPPLAEQARIVARVDELMRLCDALEAKGRLEAEQHARLLGTLLGTLTDSSTPEELAANWQRVADHFDLLLDRPEAVDALEQTILQLAVRGRLVTMGPSDEPARVLLERIAAQRQRHRTKAPVGLAELGPDVAPYELPSHWKWAQLGDLVEHMGSGWSPACDEGERSDPARWAVLRTTAVQVMEYRAREHKAIPRKFAPRPEIEVQPGDILVTRAGPMNRVGISCWVDQTPARLMLSDKIVRFHPVSDDLSPAFVVLALNAGWTRELLEAAKTGMAASQVNVSQSDLKSLWVPVCSIEEQARIVARVTELRRLCADLRQRLAASQTTQSHLAEALVAEVA